VENPLTVARWPPRLGGWGRELKFAEDDSEDAGRWSEDASANNGFGQVAFMALAMSEHF
jgi:hypothetical protein